jgi:hypothetical protein
VVGGDPAVVTPPPGPPPSLDAVRDHAAAVLAPSAEAVDASVVTRGRLAGLPAWTYALDTVPAATSRAVHEVLAGACGATYFVWAQHHTPVRILRAASHPLLPSLASGENLAGVAFAHLRRPDPGLRAAPDGDAWRLDGLAPWVTGWGLADVVLTAAVHGDDVVWALVRPGDAGLAAEPVALSVMNATRTVRLRYVDVRAEAVHVEPLAAWREADAVTTANAPPAAFGLVAAVADRLPGDAGDLLREELEPLRRSAYALADEPAGRVPERLALRGRALALGVRTAAAYVTASGGSAVLASHPAQRYAREAAFWTIQAQTAAGRAATLDALLRPAAERRSS